MKSFLLSICFVILSLTAVAQKDYQKDLAKPMIEIVGGYYVIEDYIIFKSDGGSMQMQINTQMSPDSIVHRDHLIVLHTKFMTALNKKLKTDGEVEEIDSLSGDADLEIIIFVIDGGLQIAHTSLGETKREFLSWKQVYEEM